MAEYENCKLLLVDKKITTARDIVGILEGAIRGGYPLMIMAEDIEQEPLATMVLNKLRGALKVSADSCLRPVALVQAQFLAIMPTLTLSCCVAHYCPLQLPGCPASSYSRADNCSAKPLPCVAVSAPYGWYAHSYYAVNVSCCLDDSKIPQWLHCRRRIPCQV